MSQVAVMGRLYVGLVGLANLKLCEENRIRYEYRSQNEQNGEYKRLDAFKRAARMRQLGWSSWFEGVLQLVNPRFARSVQLSVKAC